MLEAIKIIDVIRNEGIPIRETLKGGRFRCPFHEDTHPSAFAYRDTNRFFCFGCGERGDAIDFIMKLKGIGFKEARAYLGNNGADLTKRTDYPWELKKLLLEGFWEWERQYYDGLATIYRVSHKLMKRLGTMDEVEQLAALYHELPLIGHRMDILLFGSEEEKYQLFKEVNGEL